MLNRHKCSKELICDIQLFIKQLITIKRYYSKYATIYYNMIIVNGKPIYSIMFSIYIFRTWSN